MPSVIPPLALTSRSTSTQLLAASAPGAGPAGGASAGRAPDRRSRARSTADGRHEIVSVQVNIVPVSPADEGNMDVVAGAAVGLFDHYTKTMSDAEIIEALRYAADQLEAQQP